jgi:signal transduction histidine kinase
VQLSLSDISAMSHVMLHVDRFKLGQVIGNLVSNGIKFTPSGGSVEVSAQYLPVDTSLVTNRKDQSGMIVVVVKDTGFGMTQVSINFVWNIWS